VGEPYFLTKGSRGVNLPLHVFGYVSLCLEICISLSGKNIDNSTFVICGMTNIASEVLGTLPGPGVCL
jgi:hypothetical protein